MVIHGIDDYGFGHHGSGGEHESCFARREILQRNTQ